MTTIYDARHKPIQLPDPREQFMNQALRDAEGQELVQRIIERKCGNGDR